MKRTLVFVAIALLVVIEVAACYSVGEGYEEDVKAATAAGK